jgi:hypothetical protein
MKKIKEIIIKMQYWLQDNPKFAVFAYGFIGGFILRSLL